MKYKIAGFVTLALVFVAVFFISVATQEDKGKRFIEHEMAEKKQECYNCSASLCTHLPIVKIDTRGVKIPGEVIVDPTGSTVSYTKAENGEEKIISDVEIIDNDGVCNHPDDTADVKSKIMIRIRGHSSRHFEKKNYIVNLIDELGENNPQSVMGMDAHHEWALHGPYLDKTLVRNYISYTLAGQIMGYVPNVRFCEVMINGEYMGLYLMTETITAGKEGARLSLTVDKKDNTFSGYLLRVDRGSDTPLKNINSFSEYTFQTDSKVNVEYPGNANLTEELAHAIKNEFSEFEKALYSYDYDDDEHGYKKYIDEKSFIDYFLINEFASNYDASQFSTYVYKGTDGKYHMTVWDFNNAYDNYQENRTSHEQFLLQNKLWFSMLFKDEEFVEKVIQRYHELEETYLNEEYIEKLIDDTVIYLDDAVDRNFTRWGHTFTPLYDRLFEFERNHHSYDDALTHLKEFIAKRSKWMSDNIETLRQYCAESKVKQYNY